MEVQYEARILSTELIAPHSYVLKLACNELLGKFQAGQFLQIDCGGFLLRPFGIMYQNFAEGCIEVGVKVVGENTHRLVNFPAGHLLKILAPLGHGFKLDKFSHIWAVGGGSGIFPLKEALRVAQGNGQDRTLICGFKNHLEAFPRQLFASVTNQLIYSSDSGGLDFAGHAGACLEKVFCQKNTDLNPLIIACGPLPLLAYVKDFAASKQIPCQLSLEENMACGLGLCTGCAVDVLNENGDVERLRCCYEGPVFDAQKLIL